MHASQLMAGGLTGPLASMLRPLLVSAATLLWAVRLGWFLFARLSHDGKDSRFDAIKLNTLRFFNVWSVQAMWVFFTAMAVFVLNRFVGLRA